MRTLFDILDEQKQLIEKAMTFNKKSLKTTHL